MEKNQTSQASPAGIPATRNRQLVLARFFFLALFLAFSVISIQPQTTAQAAGQKWHGGHAGHARSHSKAFAPACPSDCEHAYVQCLANGGGASCDTQYDTCLAGCH
ncbi:MAG TPA: hypothetical protein VIS78_02145 [Blastocatellia bacterium]